jgi:hypothetical protein
MRAGQILDLAEKWVESSREFKWDEVPSDIRQAVINAALTFQLWATKHRTPERYYSLWSWPMSC